MFHLGSGINHLASAALHCISILVEPVVDMECTNPSCVGSNLMHAECFNEYELQLVDELAKQGEFF